MAELFLSFSGDDNGKNLVAGFFEDLCTELGNVTGKSQVELGYNYLEMRAAMKWRRELVEALGSCKVFVPLYSPRYFASEFCGKEWWGFAQRQQKHADKNKSSEPELIFPIIWESVFNNRVEMPEIAADIWARERDLGERYAQTGLRQLVQLKHHANYAHQYQEIIFALGNRLADLLHMTSLGQYELPPNIDAYENAFCVSVNKQEDLSAAIADEAEANSAQPERPASAVVLPGPRQPLSGPKHVRLVVASAIKDELREVRYDTTQYGDRQDDWAPYLPEAPQPVIAYAVQVVSEMELVPHAEVLDSEVDQLLDKAESSNELAVIILDPWTVTLEHRQEELQTYDKRLTINAGMLVPQGKDEETTTKADILHQKLLATLFRQARVRAQVFRPCLSDLTAFKESLREVLIELSRQIMVGASGAHPATSTQPSAAFTPLPVLDGPSES
ncbi:TIR-like protein FxsC [Streptomyces hirsutus]|uniref:TIR-like protein FxsC n=1 Tax=Streptomyces hirsutus TaxID=35620 RepID=UPI00341EC9FF